MPSISWATNAFEPSTIRSRIINFEKSSLASGKKDLGTTVKVNR
jgi:hypothetical protein